MRFTIICIIISLFLIASVVGIFLFLKNNKENVLQDNLPKYKEIKVVRGTFKVIVSASGIVKPINRIEIKSKASGQIEELPIEVGDFVRNGTLIAMLDQKDERTDVAQAQADLDIAKAELKQAQSTFDRWDQLFRSELISEEEQDQIELGLAVAKGKLVQATSTLDRANERLSESVVRAPVDGIILQKYVEKGQIIASGVSNVSGGTPIVDIADMSSVYIEAGIDEIDIGKVMTGQTAIVVAEAYPRLVFKGKVVRIAPEAKIEQNVTLFDVIVEVKNTNGNLKSGMNINIELFIVNKENILLAPTIALQIPDGVGIEKQNELMVLLKQGSKFVPHKVATGLSDFKQTEITSGLEEGNILGIPMTSRLKEENERLENRIRRSRSFGADKQKKTR